MTSCDVLDRDNCNLFRHIESVLIHRESILYDSILHILKSCDKKKYTLKVGCYSSSLNRRGLNKQVWKYGAEDKR
jgi:hypothetical protein